MDEGKLLVVVMVLVVIFLGIALFVFYIDRKLHGLEQKIKKLKDAGELTHKDNNHSKP